MTNNDSDLGIGNGQNEVWWSSSSDYSPAVTFNYYSCNVSTGESDITETDVVFYNQVPYTNNLAVASRLYGYGGSLRPFETTAIHELGHAFGLAHVATEYNIMGTDYYFMTTNGGLARSYLGADASDGAVQIYGLSSSTIQDLSLSHWKYLGASGQYSSHTKTILTDASGSELTSAASGGDKRFAVNGGQSVQLELTAENNGQSTQSARIGYYLSSDSTVSSSDTLITTETRSVSRGDAVTFRKALTLPSGLASGNYWLGAVIDDNNAISERAEDNNAMYVQVAYAGGGSGNQLPVANFAAAVNGLTATFTDSSSDSDGTIASRAWTFGDGGTSTATNPSRTYAAAGTYTVTLTVTDNQGGRNTTSRSVSVGGGGNQLPVANFSVAVSGLTATFTDGSSDSDGSIASRSWNFGDGTTSTATNPSKTYSAAGTYAVSLTVTDNQGGSSSTNRSVTVSTGGGLPECTAPRADQLERNCSRSNQSATSAGNSTYFWVFIPSGTTQLRITTSGGTGNADLFYNAGTWPSPSNYTQRSINSGNSESIIVNNPPGNTYVYISLYATAPYSGLKISTEF